jgi:hypothetical protein
MRRCEFIRVSAAPLRGRSPRAQQPMPRPVIMHRAGETHCTGTGPARSATQQARDDGQFGRSTMNWRVVLNAFARCASSALRASEV